MEKVRVLFVVEHNDDDTKSYRVVKIDSDMREIELCAHEYRCNETHIATCDDGLHMVVQLLHDVFTDFENGDI